MSDNYTEIVVLCEGRQDEVFIRRFLIRNGVNRHRIRIRPYPSGRGGGKQFVQVEYPKEVAEYRRKGASLQNIALVVMHDCDTDTLDETRARMERAAVRAPHDRIALFFPRRKHRNLDPFSWRRNS